MTGTLYYDQIKKMPVIKSGNQTLHLDHGEMIEVMNILPGMVNQGSWNVLKINYNKLDTVHFGIPARIIT